MSKNEEYKCDYAYEIPRSNNLLVCKLTNMKCVCCSLEPGKLGFTLNFNSNYCPGKILNKKED